MSVQKRTGAGRLVSLALALVAASWPLTAAAQTPVGSSTATGELGLGGMTTWGDDEEGKYLEYRDLDRGLIGDYRLLLTDPSSGLYLRSQGENPGYDDQRLWLETGRHGVFKLDAFVRELPHVFSTQARSLYTHVGNGTLRLPPGVQAAIAGGGSSQLASELQGARGTDLELSWLEAGGGLELQWGEALRLYGSYRLQDKEGTRARAIGWGTPGGNFAVFPLEVDEKIHEVRAGGEWLRGTSSLSLEYLGSFFHNDLRQAVVDNPLVAADSVTASTRGRMALAPDNAAHSLALSGSSPLPLAFPARLIGSVVYGVRLQDQSFLPHTLNPAILALGNPGLVLPQGDLDGRVETLLASFRVSLDPNPELDVDLRYRIYRYDNESDELLFPEHVTNDGAVASGAHRSVASDYTVQKASVNTRHRLSRRLTGHVGYFWEHWHRSDDRQVEDLHEHGPTAKLDWRVSPGTTAHASYAFRTRNGDGYDPFAYFDESLDAQGRADARSFGESPRLRKFDQADRDTHRLDVQARTLRGERLELGLSGGLYLADYRNTDLGLTDRWTWNLGGEAYYQLSPRVGVRGYYDFEAILDEQDARWRPRSFAGLTTAVDDPLNGWSSRTRSRFHTAGVGLDLTLVEDRVDLVLGYEFHHGRERTTSSGPAGLVAAAPPTTSGDGGNAAFFPEIEERLHALTADLTLRLGERVSLVAQYRYEDFDLDDDFRRQGLGPFLAGSNVNGSGAITPSTDIFLANDVRSYQAHVLRLLARLRF